MTDIHVNYDNIRSLLIGIKQNLNQSINNIDLTEEQKNLIIKADKLKIDGDGNSYLSDDGTYKPINLEELETIHAKITDVYNLFKITENKELSWSKSIDIPYNLYNFGAEIYNNNIYCIGGDLTNKSEGTNKVSKFNISSNTWSYVSSLPIAIYNGKSTICNNQIYFTGAPSSDIYKYDISSDTWSLISSLPNDRYELTIENKDDKIYFIAGDKTKITNVFDIKTSTWSTVANCINIRIRLSSCISDNNIYCIGGYGLSKLTNEQDYLNILEIYDIKSNTWTIGPYMPVSTGYLSSELYKDKIYCIGGYINPHKVQIYDIKSNTWKLGIDLPTWKYEHSSVIKDNKIYCIGGTNRSTDILNLPHTSYDINLPSNIQSKIDIIHNDGDGNKLLADNGTYIEYSPSGYRELNVDELNALIEEIKTV